MCTFKENKYDKTKIPSTLFKMLKNKNVSNKLKELPFNFYNQHSTKQMYRFKINVRQLRILLALELHLLIIPLKYFIH